MALFMGLVFWVSLIWLVVAIINLRISIILRLCLLPVAIQGFLFLIGFIYGFVSTLLGA